jgi:hypothetical protein
VEIAAVACADGYENFERALHHSTCKIGARAREGNNLLIALEATKAKLSSPTDKKHDDVNCVMTIMS